MSEFDEYHIATATVTRVAPHEIGDVHTFYRGCMEATANRQKPIDWKRMTERRIGDWVSAQVLHQMKREAPIPDQVTGQIDPRLQPGPFDTRVATWIADSHPDPRVWPPDETPEVETRYLNKFALNPRLMGHRVLPLIADRIAADLRAQGVGMVRFDHIPALNDHYDAVFPNSQNMGGRLFNGFDGEVYVVRRQLAIPAT